MIIVDASAIVDSLLGREESLNVPLLTRDGRLARASGHTARIEYIE
jgi:predicted nucleic acid-binding protein